MRELRTFFNRLWDVIYILGSVTIWMVLFVGVFLGYITVLAIVVFTVLVVAYMVFLAFRKRSQKKTGE